MSYFPFLLEGNFYNLYDILPPILVSVGSLQVGDNFGENQTSGAVEANLNWRKPPKPIYLWKDIVL